MTKILDSQVSNIKKLNNGTLFGQTTNNQIVWFKENEWKECTFPVLVKIYKNETKSHTWFFVN